MDKTYADTVRLLLAVVPDVFANDIFAMKGGLHRKQGSGLNIWTCEVKGPRKSKRLHGYLCPIPPSCSKSSPLTIPTFGS